MCNYLMFTKCNVLFYLYILIILFAFNIFVLLYFSDESESWVPRSCVKSSVRLALSPAQTQCTSGNQQKQDGRQRNQYGRQRNQPNEIDREEDQHRWHKCGKTNCDSGLRNKDPKLEWVWIRYTTIKRTNYMIMCKDKKLFRTINVLWIHVAER